MKADGPKNAVGESNSKVRTVKQEQETATASCKRDNGILI